MKQKFVLKVQRLEVYFVSIDLENNIVDVKISKEKNDVKLFDSFLEAKEWLKKINSNEMAYKKYLKQEQFHDWIWEIVLVDVFNDSEDYKSFNEVFVWYSTTEE